MVATKEQGVNMGKSCCEGPEVSSEARSRTGEAWTKTGGDFSSSEVEDDEIVGVDTAEDELSESEMG